MLLDNYLRKYDILPFVIVGFFLAFYNSSLSIHCGQNLGCIDPYWAQFWTISYLDGYERRFLLGVIINLIYGNTVSYTSLNMLAFIISISTLSLIYFYYFKKYILNRLWIFCLLILLTGHTTTLFFEVLGDPLKVCFLIFLLYLFISKNLNKYYSLILGIFLFVVTMFIHEASIFLFYPALYLIFHFSFKIIPNFKYLILSIIIIAPLYAILFNDQIVVNHTLGILTSDGTIFVADKLALPSFAELLNQELKYYFSSLFGIILFLFKILRATFWPIFIVYLFTNLLEDKNLFKVFICLLSLSSPLYIIAHDWGRFEIYTLLLSLCLSRLQGNQNIGFSFNFLTKIENALSCFPIQPFYLLGFLPFLYIATPIYRISGLSIINTVYFIISILFFFTLIFNKQIKLSNK